MANQEHLEILKQGVEVWNRWQQENPDVRPDLSATDLSKMNLRRADFNWADIHGTNLSKTELGQADLREADLSDTLLLGADLTKANLTEANLTRSDLRKANLIEADLSRAILSHACLIDASLIGADISGAELVDANLSEANLAGADLSNADLQFSNLTGANLSGVEFSGANLIEVDFSRATAGWTKFTNIDLSQVKGLDAIRHLGPSIISIDTIYRSKGKISEPFLKAVGVPDTFITYITSLTNEAVQYYSCFISYSSKNETFAQRLYADLQQRGVRCWFAPRDLKIGDKIRPVIDQSIRIHDKLLLVLSRNSVTSQWVEQEVETALERERKQDEKVLFPVRLDNAVMEIESGWSALIRNTRHVGDFSQWKEHDKYQKAFERLLRDLRAEEKRDG